MLFKKVAQVVSVLLFALAAATGVAAQGKSGERIPDQYIVVLKEKPGEPPGLSHSQASERAREVLAKHGVGKDNLQRAYRRALRGFVARLNAGELARLEKDPQIDYVEPDRVITLAPPQGGGHTNPTAEQVPWGVARVGGPVSGAGKTAWVIDTGVNLDHPDLTVDRARSVTFITRGRDAKTPDDMNGHGSHVAGTIAALDNEIGVVGVAAGAVVVAVKVLDANGSGAYSGVIAGVDHVAAEAAPGDVANMSLGGSPSNALDQALRNAAAAGVLFAIAAGNEAQNANNSSPARVEAPNVWTVSAHDRTDVFASFSNFSGPTQPPIEFAAPGVAILSTWKGGGYNTISGTSMASPHVAGLLLLKGSAVATDGVVKSGDPDGDPDPIAHY